MSEGKRIYCCGCAKEVDAQLINGSKAYPNRRDLHSLPFWQCLKCKNFVGCHHKTINRTRPLGVIPTPVLKSARKHIHLLIDPLWKEGLVPRGKLYKLISHRLGYEYHTAEIRSFEEARRIYKIVRALSHELIQAEKEYQN